MIHKEGKLFLIYTIILLLLIIILIFIFLPKKICIAISFLSLIIYSFLIFFFRNPKIKTNFSNEIKKRNFVVSPADGKILMIEKVFENEYLKKKCIKISIFISPFNVHVNRYPVSGQIIYSKYYPGKHLIAWLKKSSFKNEHTTVVIKTENKNKILLRQIAGFIARRIVCYAKEKFIVKKRDDLGFIKFGSRVDIFIPINSKILIKKGEKVIGGITDISILPK
ncbi:phosphatidylserine decarboxylase family protein [Blattabacterium cuenoti]|uniref:phosphatidylserine decarboxylase family protein n=1 Tax=Blattabacterium cuenoti TaxID=1653831 RepID=UPI00163CFA9E|nr:phosphatidylserine decarboxylase family protein [Blattabacterium cuenoti]